MEFGVPPIGRPEIAATRPTGPARQAPGAGPDFRVTLSEAAQTLPPELPSQVEAAARRWKELRDMGRELRFEPDPQTGRIAVEVRDLDGNLIRAVPPSVALDIAAGAPLP